MPYCPDCLTEYVEGTDKCEDCGAALAPGSPPVRMPVAATGRDKTRAIGRLFRSLVGAGEPDDSPEVKTVRVRTFNGPTATLDAELARNVLESQGIPTILPGEASIEMLPFLEISLLVSEDDLPRAQRILKDYFDTPGPNLVE
jgi:Putative prokaryotic signal transducing protein